MEEAWADIPSLGQSGDCAHVVCRRAFPAWLDRCGSRLRGGVLLELEAKPGRYGTPGTGSRPGILRYLQKCCADVESFCQAGSLERWDGVGMVQSAAADEVFHALSNPTRRRVLERLSVGPATVSELAAPFDMQLPSFVQHLSVLEQSRLVKSRKRGRVRTYELAPERLKVVEDWLTARRREWEGRLDRFDQYVKQLKEKESES